MFLHDFSDPWMETAKLFNYCLMPSVANSCFMVFASSFLYLRAYIFPRYVIRATLYDFFLFWQTAANHHTFFHLVSIPVPPDILIIGLLLQLWLDYGYFTAFGVS